MRIEVGVLVSLGGHARRICLAIDSQGYTKVPPNRSPACLILDSPTYCLNVIDSIIEEESVPAMATFLAGIGPRAISDLRLRFGDFGLRARLWPGGLRRVYRDRWAKVRGRTKLERLGSSDDFLEVGSLFA
ncbi:hypothetical protein OG21DRAFT_1514497 [Imleria badia]|nr:hypothetical protein OG21DRAFT_1514497 [Imleria badia]